MLLLLRRRLPAEDERGGFYESVVVGRAPLTLQTNVLMCCCGLYSLFVGGAPAIVRKMPPFASPLFFVAYLTQNIAKHFQVLSALNYNFEVLCHLEYCFSAIS